MVPADGGRMGRYVAVEHHRKPAFAVVENNLPRNPSRLAIKRLLFYTTNIPIEILPVTRPFEPDATDRAILRLIQKDAALSLADIAKEVGLTPTPCWKRIRRMEQEGVITGRVVLVDPAKVGLGVSVMVAIETGDHSAPWIEAFAATVARMPEIVECWRLGGDVDYLLRVVVPDMAAFDAFYRRLTAEVPSLRKVTSRFAMERVKSTTALPI
jgi:Lrp/AsnC family transcriptional regulator